MISMAKYLGQIPGQLLRDIISQRTVPIVGAGFSANATLPHGATMPTWDQLGRQFASLVGPDYQYVGPIDAISAFDQEFSRPKSVEQLRVSLHIGESRPGPAHIAFARLAFDEVITTNFDFLLERAYEEADRDYVPILEQQQLSVNPPEESVRLVKIHGDVNHPSRLILNEEDYDTFIADNPLLSTFVSSLLIQRSPILLGYSFDDPDLRQLWQIVSNRLGTGRRLGYVILVNPSEREVLTFRRRGISVIPLHGRKKERPTILASLFNEIKNYWDEKSSRNKPIANEETLSELSLPASTTTRLCFFSVPLKLQSYYRANFFASVERFGFAPATATDLLTPRESLVSAISTLIDRSALVIVDVTSDTTVKEAKYANDRKQRLLIVVENDQQYSEYSEVGTNVKLFKRPQFPMPPTLEDLRRFENIIERYSIELQPTLRNEPTKLLQLREYRSAVVSAFSLMESTLRSRLLSVLPENYSKIYGSAPIFELAKRVGLIPEDQRDSVTRWRSVRNRIIHTGASVSKAEATRIVSEIMDFLNNLSQLNRQS